MQRRIWRAHPFDVHGVAELSVGAGISPLLAQLLVNRGIRSPEAALAFLHPSFEHVHDPMRLPNMGPAVERLRRAIDAGEKIIIYGDYDVDGTTATALLLTVLRHLGGTAEYYIPDRASEGYGMNVDAMRAIKERGADVLLTVDCGVTADEPIAEAHRLGLDVIVTDHHSVDPQRIPAPETVVALIDPKLEGHDYPFHELAGVGLAFKIAHALIGGDLEGGNPFLLAQLDLVALGTIADMAELRDENRALAKFGLEVMNRRERPGIRALCEVAGVSPDAELTGYHIGFVLGPRINASGRLDTAHKVVDLLTTDSDIEATDIALRLNEENDQRRQIERRIQSEAIEIIEQEGEFQRNAAILIAREGWHPGVVGIVASRLTERYWRPTVLIALDGELGRGSGRSIPELDLHSALLECREWMVTFGGHAAAAGMTVRAEDVSPLREAFLAVARDRLSDEDLVPKLDLDVIVPLDELQIEAVEELALLEPMGESNPRPRVGLRGLRVNGAPRLMGGEREHLSVTLTDGQRSIRVVSWRGAEYAIPLKTPHAEIDVAGAVAINEYRGRRSVQLTARDWAIHTEGPSVDHGFFPPRERPSCARIVDNRHRLKKAEYLARVVARNEPTVIYVRDERAIGQAREIFRESGCEERVADCPESLGPDELRAKVTELLAGTWAALVAVPDLTPYAEPDAWATVRHIIFCHPPSDDAAFLAHSSPALMGWQEGTPADEEVRYVHLLFNERDVEVDRVRVRAENPDAETLRQVFRALMEHEDGLTEEEWRDRLDPQVRAALDRARCVFEELGLIEDVPKQPSRFRARAGSKRDLQDSPTFRRSQIVRRAHELQAVLWKKRTARDIWELLLRHRRTLVVE